MSDITKEIEKRRTFAIISHPDAGKTTLTEKFLLYGGAINQAGSVKGKATAKHAVSDWMEIEKERGISVTSSVLQFNYGGYCINILDTPGHQDFSEDTYRTLMAADSAVMVIDASKGVEAQTRKLFKVCVMRHIPIFTFINKMDREAKDTFDLLDEIEKELGIATCPVNWPIGSGKEFKGVFDRQKQEVELFSDTKKGTSVGEVKKVDINNPEIDWLIGTEAKVTLEEEIELLDGAAAEFDQELVSKGELSPVFFGSALTNFGVETFLQHFLAMTSSPLPRMSDQGPIDPMKEKDFSAFVFKIQANMNKAHRDRIAFMRICSGEFEAGMNVYHIQGGREVRLSQPQQMMASERKMIDKAYGGDIIGVFDPGIFSIGDTLTPKGSSITEGKTKPKPLHTEATLLSAMETAGKEIEDDALRQAMKDCGIGTPATRASIIETLFKRGYMERCKKSLVPTEKGLALNSVVKTMRIADVAMTGEWEKELARIERGELSDDTFRKEIEAYTREITSELISCDKLFGSRDSGCACPKCGTGRMRFYGKVVRCDNTECGLPVFRLKAGRTLSDDEIKDLLTEGHTKLLKGFKSKQGKSFDAVVAFDGEYNTTFVFPEAKKDKKFSGRKK